MKQFIKPQPTLIIANGEKPSIELVKIYQQHAHMMLALDGAIDWLLEHKIIPNMVIGDMDSARAVGIDGVKRVSVPDQNSNDLEKGLRYCLDQGWREVTIMGAFGLRIDHFLTNLYVLKKFAPTMSINMIDAHQSAFICPLNKEISFNNLKNSFISFFPLSEQVGPITSTGVAYPLHGEMLSLHERIGTLNTITSERATLLCQGGDLLVVVPNSVIEIV